MKPRIEKLTRTLRHLPDNKPAMYLLTHTLRSTGELHVVAVAIEFWMSAVQGTRLDLTVLRLYWEQTLESSAHSVRSLWLFLARRPPALGQS